MLEDFRKRHRTSLYHQSKFDRSVRLRITPLLLQELEKFPCLCVKTPPREVDELDKKGAKVWQHVNTEKRELCEEAVEKVKQKVMRRRILLKPVFRDCDKLKIIP